MPFLTQSVSDHRFLRFLPEKKKEKEERSSQKSIQPFMHSFSCVGYESLSRTLYLLLKRPRQVKSHQPACLMILVGEVECESGAGAAPAPPHLASSCSSRVSCVVIIAIKWVFSIDSKPITS
jgi:16S rRNA C1402 (ribose-2'-O) methylase RsmI